MKSQLAIIIALLVSFAVLADTGTPANVSLTKLNERFNMEAAEHDSQGILALYSDSPVWIEQGKPATVGLEGPRALFEFVASNKGLVTHTIDHLFVSDDASLAVMIGSVVAKVETVGLDATGTYLFVLTPDDNDWEIVVDMWHQHEPKP